MTWALPLELSDRGDFGAERPRWFLDTARLVLAVAPGERRLLPEFGWRAHLLPDLDGPLERQVAAALAEEALRLWAPDLEVERVDVTAVEGRIVELELVSHGETSRLRVELCPGGVL